METAREYAYRMKRIYATRSKELCARLEKARCEANITQEAVAIAIGRSQAFMSRIRQGKLVIAVPELVQLAAMYRKPLRYFFDGWCTVGWSEEDDNSQYSPEAARGWELKVTERRKRRKRRVRKLYGYRDVPPRKP